MAEDRPTIGLEERLARIEAELIALRELAFGQGVVAAGLASPRSIRTLAPAFFEGAGLLPEVS